jgi:hypothetical protein
MAHFADEEPQPAAAQGQPPAQGQTPQCACQQPAPAQATPPQEQVKAQPLPKKTCPHCKAGIDEFEYKRAIIECGTADTDGISHMVDYDSEGSKEEIVVFSCPSCHVALFTSADDAVDFLED